MVTDPAPLFPAPLFSLSTSPCYQLMFQTSVFGMFLLPTSPTLSPPTGENKHPSYTLSVACEGVCSCSYSYRTSLQHSILGGGGQEVEKTSTCKLGNHCCTLKLVKFELLWGIPCLLSSTTPSSAATIHSSSLP